MKIKVMIKELEEALKEFGNIQCSVFDHEQFCDGFLVEVPAYLSFARNKKGKVTKLTFCDEETQDSFTGGFEE